MSVCLDECNNVCIYDRYIHKYIRIYVSMYVCIYIDICVCMCVCDYVCEYVCIYVCVNVWKLVCLYVCIYVCVCMYVLVWSTKVVNLFTLFFSIVHRTRDTLEDINYLPYLAQYLRIDPLLKGHLFFSRQQHIKHKPPTGEIDNYNIPGCRKKTACQRNYKQIKCKLCNYHLAIGSQHPQPTIFNYQWIWE